MRAPLTLVLFAGMAGLTLAQDQPQRLTIVRYGVKLDLENYSQRTPKDTLASVIKAIQDKKVNYLLAQLADPAFIDRRVNEQYGGRFDDLLKEATARFLDEPEVLKALVRFTKEGTWADMEAGATTATASIKDSRDRLFLRKLEDRWFLEDRRTEDKPARKE